MARFNPMAVVRSSVLNKLLLSTGGLFVAAGLALVVVWYATLGQYFDYGEGWETSTLVAVMAGIGILVIVFILMFAIGRRLMEPLDEVVDSIEAACQGEIGRKVDVEGKDEFGRLGRSYNQMVDLIIYLIKQAEWTGFDQVYGK